MSPYRTLIQTQELRPLLENDGVIVIDCRFDLADLEAGRRAYLEAHIKGAVYAHLDEDLSGPQYPGSGRHPLPSPKRLEKIFGKFGVTVGRQVVAYDASGGMVAARLWWQLRYMGHEAVAVLDGGWPAWIASGGDTASGEQRNPPTKFEGRPHFERVVETKQVLEQRRLVDSRDPARYRGESEPIDPVAGHIPGAVNYFCKRNLTADGRFLTPAALRPALSGVFGAVPAAEVTFYCGSGVTACHNILATVHAGFQEPRLYAGSWSEWCADPARPVARGEAP
ncbi:MAG TPA: sulfurtransferase [Gammaproteobacteria bacterium]|nr:sulfurtransferase [Gammaproteobacteria bacterium]